MVKDKSLLNNIVKHVNIHNKIIEEEKCWREHETKKRLSSRERSSVSSGSRNALMQEQELSRKLHKSLKKAEYIHDKVSSLGKKEPLKVNTTNAIEYWRSLAENEANKPKQRWKHDGYEVLEREVPHISNNFQRQSRGYFDRDSPKVWQQRSSSSSSSSESDSSQVSSCSDRVNSDSLHPKLIGNNKINSSDDSSDSASLVWESDTGSANQDVDYVPLPPGYNSSPAQPHDLCAVMESNEEVDHEIENEKNIEQASEILKFNVTRKSLPVDPVFTAESPKVSSKPPKPWTIVRQKLYRPKTSGLKRKRKSDNSSSSESSYSPRREPGDSVDAMFWSHDGWDEIVKERPEDAQYKRMLNKKEKKKHKKVKKSKKKSKKSKKKHSNI